LSTWHQTGPGCWYFAGTAREHALRHLAAAETTEGHERDQFTAMANLWLRTAEHDETELKAERREGRHYRNLAEYEVRTSREPVSMALGTTARDRT
jgi:hypothetical protein